MANRSRYFDRLPDYLNTSLLRTRRVVIVGMGMVGSPIAEELARCAVGRFRFIDHDPLEEENLIRHVLTDEYLNVNKAEAMARYLQRHIRGIIADPIPRKIDELVTEAQLDKWLADANLVIAATDDRVAQRRVMQSALALDIPALAPTLYVNEGGEIILQWHWSLPCFGCWDYFRQNAEQLRGVRVLGFTRWPVIHTTIDLALGLLDPDSGHGEIMTEGPGRPPNQVFRLDRVGVLECGQGTRREDCPSCGGGPASQSPTRNTVTGPLQQRPTRSDAPTATTPTLLTDNSEKLAIGCLSLIGCSALAGLVWVVARFIVLHLL